MPTALVLSGGGSRGDFQLGAVTALYEHGIRPDIICATSVGSLNAVMLAQQDPGPDDLRRIWMGLRRNDHMWQFEDWWVEVHPELRKLIIGAINEEESPPSLEPWAVHSAMFFGAAVGTIAFGPGALIAGALGGTFAAGLTGAVTAAAIQDALRLVSTRARGLINLAPIRTLFEEHFNQPRFDAWVASGKQLRMATVGLNSGQLAYVTETGDLLDRTGVRLATGVSILDGALASSSIAAVFPPVAIAEDFWIDGGHRDNMPLKAAIELGADVIYAIASSPVDARSSLNRTTLDAPAETFADAKVTSIARRALVDIHLDEMVADDIYPHLGADGAGAPRIVLIAPHSPTHDITTIDPGLIRVNVDYGYRAALDTLAGAPDALRAASDRIAMAAGKIARSHQVTFHSRATPPRAEIPEWRRIVAEGTRERAQANLASRAPDCPNPFPFSDQMTPGDRLLPGQAIRSPNRRMTLVYQFDGNLVLYDADAGAALWAAGTDGQALGFVAMQRDGNFVIYDEDVRPIWASNTPGRPEANLRLQNGGDLVIFHGNVEIWSTGTGTPDPSLPARSMTVRNFAAVQAHVRIFKTDDTIMTFALPDGDFHVASGGERSWAFPADVEQAKLIIDGRHVHIVIPEQLVEHRVDDRIRIDNATRQPVFFRIFNANDIVRLFALPGGEINLAAGETGFFTVPPDIERVVLQANGREIASARRGELVRNIYDPHIYVDNHWDREVAVRFYKQDDVLRVITLPAGDRRLQAGQSLEFEVPSDVPIIQVRVEDLHADANPGDTVVVQDDGRLAVTSA